MVTISTLPATTEAEIRELLDSGDYENATDIVIHAITALSNRQAQTKRLQSLIQEGIDDFDAGKVKELSPELLSERWELALDRYRMETPEPASESR